MLFRVVAVIAVMALGSASAFAEPEREKLQVFKDIQEQISGYGFITIFDDIEVDFADDGVVRLTGSVTQLFKRRDIAKRVARVDGVSSVENAIDVLPLSRFDNQLRFRVARAIYGHPMYQHYSRGEPPIHIVVNRGHVTLTGVVDSETDKALARSLASQQFGAYSVTNALKTNEEATAELELLG